MLEEKTNNNLVFNLKEYMVIFNGKKLDLSLKEFEVLSFLARHPGWVFTKEQIYEAVYKSKEVEDINNAIFCLIYSLRRKLGPSAKSGKYIKTVRSVGYKLDGVVVKWITN